MPGRTRTQSFPAPKGTGGRFGALWGGGTRTVWTGTCDDVTGYGDNAAFTVHKVYVEGGRLNKGVVGDYWSAWFQDYLVDGFDNIAIWDHIGAFDGDQPNTVFATRAASRTNPSRPYVDVPVAILELKDMIPLIRDHGRELFRGSVSQQLAQSNLFNNFGIRPLVNDLVSIFRFREQVDRRVQEIQRLQSKKGLRRTITMGGFSKTSLSNRTVQSVGVGITVPVAVVSQLTVKAHVRWMPDTDVSGMLTPDRMRALATRSVLGLTVDPSTVWNLIPWSWLVDWSSTVGDYLSATRNIVPAVVSDLSIIRHTKTTHHVSPSHWSDVKFDGAKVVRETKMRAKSFVTPTAHFPFLNGNQVGILASLAMARR